MIIDPLEQTKLVKEGDLRRGEKKEGVSSEREQKWIVSKKQSANSLKLNARNFTR